MLERELEIFRTVMTAGSATRAARLLGLSQSAVSQSLQRLEKRAGLALFHRAAGKLQPTREAAALLVEVQRHYVGLDLIEHRLRTLSQLGAGRVRIASFPGPGVAFLPRVLGELAAECEHGMVSLQIMGSQDVRDRVLRGEADFGLVSDDVSVSGLEHALFAHYFGVVALPAGHALANEAVITPRQIAAYPFISLNPDDAVSVRLDALCAQHGVRLRTVMECPYTISLCELVRNRVGIAIVNPITAYDYLHAGLVFRPFSARLDFSASSIRPAPHAPSQFIQALLAAMRSRLERDMRALRETMPGPAEHNHLHQFQKLSG